MKTHIKTALLWVALVISIPLCVRLTKFTYDFLVKFYIASTFDETISELLSGLTIMLAVVPPVISLLYLIAQYITKYYDL